MVKGNEEIYQLRSSSEQKIYNVCGLFLFPLKIFGYCFLLTAWCKYLSQRALPKILVLFDNQDQDSSPEEKVPFSKLEPSDWILLFFSGEKRPCESSSWFSMAVQGFCEAEKASKNRSETEQEKKKEKMQDSRKDAPCRGLLWVHITLTHLFAFQPDPSLPSSVPERLTSRDLLLLSFGCSQCETSISRKSEEGNGEGSACRSCHPSSHVSTPRFSTLGYIASQEAHSPHLSFPWASARNRSPSYLLN